LGGLTSSASTNAFLEDEIFSVDAMYQRLQGGDYWCMKEACEFVRGLVIIFQKGAFISASSRLKEQSDWDAEAISLFFPSYLAQQAQMYASQEQEQMQQQQQAPPRKEKSGGCCIM
jgi:hypothetical protein